MQGRMLRDTPSPYLAALALAAGPNLVGHIVGPIAAVTGFWWVSFKDGPKVKKSKEAGVQFKPGSV